MASPLAPGKYMAEAALGLITMAATTIPAAWPIVEITIKGQNDPGTMYDVGQS